MSTTSKEPVSRVERTSPQFLRVKWRNIAIALIDPSAKSLDEC